MTPLLAIKKLQPSAPRPYVNDWYAQFAVAITVCIMCYAGMFGFYPILVFFLLWFPFTFHHGKFNLSLSPQLIPILAIPTLAFISSLWSDFPLVTAKSSCEFISMLACSVIIARVTSIQSFIKGIVFGVSIALIATLIDGTYGIDTFTGTSSLIGLFGSKNQVGLTAEIGIFLSLLLLFSNRKVIKWRFIYVVPLVICLYSLILSRSMTSILSLIVVCLISFTAYILTKLSHSIRGLALMFILAITIAVAAICFCFGTVNSDFTLFGKDATLTGRTFLWMKGLTYAWQHPLFGCGYAAFWVPGRPEAEELWFKFGIFNRLGFHFHDEFIQALVDLGVTGLASIIYVLIASLKRSMKRVVFENADLLGFYCLGISVMYLIRAFVEVDLWGTYSLSPLLFYSIIPRLTKYTAQKQVHGWLIKRSDTQSRNLLEQKV